MVWEYMLVVCLLVFMADSLFGIGPNNKWMIDCVRVRKGLWFMVPLIYMLVWTAGALCFIAGVIMLATTLAKTVGS